MSDLNPVVRGSIPTPISNLGRITGEIKKLFMPFHSFEYSKLTDHSIFPQQKSSWLPAEKLTWMEFIWLQFPMQQCLYHCEKGLSVTIILILTSPWVYCKLYLGSRDFVRHIREIKTQLLGLISLIQRKWQILPTARIQWHAQDVNSGHPYYRADARPHTEVLVHFFERIHTFVLKCVGNIHDNNR